MLAAVLLAGASGHMIFRDEIPNSLNVEHTAAVGHMSKIVSYVSFFVFSCTIGVFLRPYCCCCWLYLGVRLDQVRQQRAPAHPLDQVRQQRAPAHPPIQTLAHTPAFAQHAHTRVAFSLFISSH